MFSVSLKDVLSVKPIFERLVAVPLPLKVSRRVGKIIEQLNKEYKEFEDLRQKLIIRLGTKEGDDTYVVSPENREAFVQELDELLAEQVSFNCDKLQVSDIPDEFGLTPMEVLPFENFLDVTD